MSSLAKAVVDATFDDVVWAAAVRDLGADRAVAILKGAYDDIGLQVQQRAADLANLRDSESRSGSRKPSLKLSESTTAIKSERRSLRTVIEALVEKADGQVLT